MDKSDFLNFVISVQWHCTNFTKTARFNGDIDRAVRGVSDNRPELTKRQLRRASS